jgi:hypothetical protein
MPRSLGNPDRDFLASQSKDDIDADIAGNLFASLVVGYSQLIDDSQIRFRVGKIIAQATNHQPRRHAGEVFARAYLNLQDEHPEPAYAASQRCPSLIVSP